MSTEEFSVLDWMQTGTVAERKVTAYNDQSAYSDYLEWERRYEEAEKEHKASGGEEVLGSKDAFAELDAEGERILARLESSKAVWTMRALSEEQLDEIGARFPLPKDPTPPGRNADRAALKKFNDYLKGEFAQELEAAVNAQNYAILEAAFVKMETPKGTVETVNVDQLRKMNSYPHGAQLLKRLQEAVKEANASEVEPPAPKLRASSENIRDS